MATGFGSAVGVDAAADGPRDGASEWARGWPIVFCGFVGMICATSSLGEVGVVMQPLHAAFGWSRAQVSAALLIACAGVTIVSPLVGLAMQRVGARRVALWGLVVYMAALAGVSLAGPSLWSWYLAWAVFGLVTPTASTLVWTMGVGQRFRRHRGLAFALVGTGAGIGFLIGPLLAAALLPLVGWRGVFRCTAAGLLLVAWPIMFLLFRPDNAPARRDPVAVAGGYAPARVLGSARFWCLAAAGALLGFAVGGMTVHLLPIMRDAGLGLWQAAKYTALLGPASVVGNLLAGRLLDRAPARLVTALCFAAPAVACVILLNYDGSATLSIAAAVLLGAAAGIEANLLAYLVSRHFGLRAYGVAFGLVIGLFSLAYGLAPVVAGAVFDATGSYRSILLVWLAGLLLSVLLAQLLGRPPSFEPEAATAGG